MQKVILKKMPFLCFFQVQFLLPVEIFFRDKGTYLSIVVSNYRMTYFEATTISNFKKEELPGILVFFSKAVMSKNRDFF